MPPNILIFMTDQEQGTVLHPDHPCQTPHASRLAQEGIYFRNAFTPTAHCCPSRATFMTGLYPSRHGVFNNILTPTRLNAGLKEGVVTMAEMLGEAGYNLAYAGKWHVSGEENPADRGWEELYVTGRTEGYRERRLDWWAERDISAEQTCPRERGQIKRPGWGDYQLYDSYPTDGPKGYENERDYEVVQSALEALPRLAGKDAPWVLFIGPSGPHDPFIIPERFAQMYYPDDIPLPANYYDSLRDKPNVYQRMRKQYWSQLAPEEVRESIQHYWGYCTMIDQMFGEVLEALEETGQADDTLVLRMSDHGEYAGAHGLYCKGVPAFREAYNIAAIARWPQGIHNPGREVDAFITHADILPTFLELAGLPIPDDLSGRSLMPLLANETPDDWPDTFYSQFNGVELYYTQRVVMTHDYKYVYNGFDFDELYDLRHDPHELINLSDHPDYQEIKRDLVGRMWRFADREKDIIFNPYVTVALAPWGPAVGLEE